MANENLNITVNTVGDEKVAVKIRALDRMLEQTKKRAAALNPMRVNIVAKLDDRITGPAKKIQNIFANMSQKSASITIAGNYSVASGKMSAVPASDLGEKIVRVLERIMVTVNNCDKQLATILNKLEEITGKAWASGTSAMLRVPAASTLNGNMLNARGPEAIASASGSGEKLGVSDPGMMAASIIGFIGRKSIAGIIAPATRVKSRQSKARTFFDRPMEMGGQLWQKVKDGAGTAKGSLMKGWETVDKRYNITQTYGNITKRGISPKLRKFAKGAEKWLKPVDFALDAYELYKAAPDEKGKQWGKAIGKWGGLIGGTILGGAPGGAVASFAGEKIGEYIGGLVDTYRNDKKKQALTAELNNRYAFSPDNKLSAHPDVKLAPSGIFLNRPSIGLLEDNRQPGAPDFAAPLAAAGAAGGAVINLNFAGMIQSLAINPADTQVVIQEVVEVVASALQSTIENQGRC